MFHSQRPQRSPRDRFPRRARRERGGGTFFVSFVLVVSGYFKMRHCPARCGIY